MKLKSTFRLSFPLASAIAVMLAAQAANAQSAFVGANNAIWATAATWSPSGAPTGTTNVTILGISGAASLALNVNFNNSNPANSITFTNPTNSVTIGNGSAADRTLTINASGGTGITTGVGAVVIGKNTGAGVPVSLGASQTWNVGAGGLTVHNRIGGAAFGLTKTGAGTLTMNGLSGGTNAPLNPTDTGNLYAGGTTVSEGLLIVNTTMADAGFVTVNTGGNYRVGDTDTVDAVTLSSGTISRTGAAVLTGSSYALTGLGTSTISAVIAGSGALTKTGAATATLSGANTGYTGAITVSEGTLTLADNNASGTAAGGIAVSGSAAATLQINTGVTTADNITFSNTNAGSSVIRKVAAASAYTTGTSGVLSSSFAGGKPDTTASILGGTSGASAVDLTMSFSSSSAATNDFIRRSDIFTTSGTGSDLYVLQLSASGQDSTSFLAYNNGSIWDLAVTGNTGTNNASAPQLNYAGTFADFQTTYGTTLSAYQGAYGLDLANNRLWAVVNYGGSFAAVPEPTSALAGLLLGAGLLRRRRGRNVEC